MHCAARTAIPAATIVFRILTPVKIAATDRCVSIKAQAPRPFKTLLVASTKDRRQIFEEAAGISRFRAKKMETLRKLESVDANLTRVRDILDGLKKNLQTLSSQASKAQKYQEHHTKLRELRISVGLHEYRELVETLARIT